jgi:hypothetical protein
MIRILLKYLVLTAIVMPLLPGSVFAQPKVMGKHGEIGATCVDCHKSDKPTRSAPISACKTCHGEYADIAKKTADMKPNPHDSHAGEVRCTLCHKSHSPSVLYCNECHTFNIKMK